MKKKFFLTVFKEFNPVLSRKDVGAIPYYLSLFRGWDSGIMYFASPAEEPPQDFSSRVRLLSMPGWFSVKTLKYFFLNSRNIGVLNIYHGDFKSLVLVSLYKFLNPGGIVYCKLDMGHLDPEIIGRASCTALSRVKLFLKSRLASSVDIFTVETRGIYEKIKDLPKYRDRTHYLPNGFHYSGKTEIKELISRKEKFIIHVGRPGAYEKNAELFLAAAARLGEKAVAGWTFLIVGKATAEFLEYYERAAELQPWLRPAVLLTGEIRDTEKLFDIYRKAKYICLTSRYESFGFAVLEAMYFGCIPVATDLPAMKDLTKNGEIGDLFPSEDLNALSVILAGIVKEDAFDAAASVKAHGTVAENFNWEKISFDLNELLEKSSG